MTRRPTAKESIADATAGASALASFHCARPVDGQRPEESKTENLTLEWIDELAESSSVLANPRDALGAKL
jgi:hypothetical protein